MPEGSEKDVSMIEFVKNLLQEHMGSDEAGEIEIMRAHRTPTTIRKDASKPHPIYVYFTEAEKGQSKTILNRNVFSKTNVEEFAKSKKNITNPKKIIGSTNNSSNNPKIFCKSIKTISNRNFYTNHY